MKTGFRTASGPLTQAQQLSALCQGVVFRELYCGTAVNVAATSPLASLLVEQTGATQAIATTGLVAGNGISEVAFNFPDNSATAAYDAPNDTIGDLDESLLIVMLVRAPVTNPGGTRTFFGKREKAGNFAGYEVVCATSGAPSATLDTGVASTSAALTGDHFDGLWHCYSYKINITALTHNLTSDLSTSGDVAYVSGTEDNTEVFTVAQHRLNSLQFEQAFIGLAYGPQVESVNQATLCSNVVAHMVV